MLDIKKIINDSIDVKTKILQNCIDQIKSASEIMVKACKNHKKILWCGNGGSAADAQHIASELSGRFYKNRPPLNAEALHVNSSYMTAVANDFGYNETYSRMLEACGRKGDILVGISTSGNSLNVINALKKANKIGLTTVGFSEF